MRSTFSQSQLRVVSAFLVNIAAGWFLAIFVTKDIFVLTTEFLLSIISLRVAFDLEEELDHL